jgi:hypothetical protein
MMLEAAQLLKELLLRFWHGIDNKASLF